ncbi:hypothetical protein TNCV_5052011 [Trichonephila clavipes]|nr:hypothetical protein TNCV_5052011 [Trichonephila clavipes]
MASHQVEGPYCDIKCKQITCVLGALKLRYIHHDAAYKTMILLRRRSGDTPISRVCVPTLPRGIYDVVSREAAIMIDV